MADTDKAVGTTADSLVVIRSGHKAMELGLEDPFAAWFVTEDGIRLVEMARQVDSVYEEFNLVRYLYTSSLLSELANRYEQMLFLGAGLDCRALWLDGLKDGRVRIYEVDTRAKLDQKLQGLQQHGAVVPEWNPHIACDLREDNVKALLGAEGLDCKKPLLVLAEGLVFYLPPDVALRILDPAWLGLARGSTMIFDCWSADRVKQLNERVAQRIGSGLFQEFPFAVEPEKLKEELGKMGYTQVQVTPLARIAQGYCRQAVEEEFPSSWLVVEATV